MRIININDLLGKRMPNDLSISIKRDVINNNEKNEEV